jgi:hypothetical protein
MGKVDLKVNAGIDSPGVNELLWADDRRHNLPRMIRVCSVPTASTNEDDFQERVVICGARQSKSGASGVKENAHAQSVVQPEQRSALPSGGVSRLAGRLDFDEAMVWLLPPRQPEDGRAAQPRRCPESRRRH